MCCCQIAVKPPVTASMHNGMVGERRYAAEAGADLVPSSSMSMKKVQWHTCAGGLANERQSRDLPRRVRAAINSPFREARVLQRQRVLQPGQQHVDKLLRHSAPRCRCFVQACEKLTKLQIIRKQSLGRQQHTWNCWMPAVRQRSKMAHASNCSSQHWPSSLQQFDEEHISRVECLASQGEARGCEKAINAIMCLCMHVSKAGCLTRHTKVSGHSPQAHGVAEQ